MNINKINKTNVSNVRSQILQKKSYKPYFSDKNTVSLVLTDYDNFPYKRYFRGIPSSVNPIVAEREAGWRIRNDNCYDEKEPQEVPGPINYCFEAPCSTVYPCNPDYLSKYSDRDALNVMLNNACIVAYR